MSLQYPRLAVLASSPLRLSRDHRLGISIIARKTLKVLFLNLVRLKYAFGKHISEIIYMVKKGGHNAARPPLDVNENNDVNPALVKFQITDRGV